jgi:tetratricopeptide (TPR) repeat protein
MDLPSALADEIDRLSESGNSLLEDRRDWRGAVAKWQQALSLLPAPASQWEAWTWLNASIGEAFRVGDALPDAKAALLDAQNGPDGHTNPFILLRLGQTLVDLDEFDKGVEYLLRAYMIGGKDLFDEDGATAYWKLLLDRQLVD